jgi:hypothetical protein
VPTRTISPTNYQACHNLVTIGFRRSSKDGMRRLAYLAGAPRTFSGGAVVAEGRNTVSSLYIIKIVRIACEFWFPMHYAIIFSEVKR